MGANRTFMKTVLSIAIPVALQCMLQSSFSIIDQIMIGQLGSISIAAVGIAGKFSSIYQVVVSAIAVVAGIMIAQYMGKQEQEQVDKSLSVNLAAAILLALGFTASCLGVPELVMGIYTEDTAMCAVAASYLRLIAFTFLPMAGAILLSTMLRCMEKASLPLYASIVAAIVNTGLNYVLIFGKLGFAPMGVDGAAIATVMAQIANFLLILGAFLKSYRKTGSNFHFSLRLGTEGYRQYLWMLLPILITEFMWSLGENVYASIYGHMGTIACAAMTLTNPIQGLMIGALSGLSQAAGILIGKSLGKKDYDEAYANSKKLIWYGLCGAVILSALLITTKAFYVDIYAVEAVTKAIASDILLAFALVAPIKVLNMILGGGIVRSGGKTKLIMWIDLMGTWIFGVPLGYFSAFVLNLPIPYVYFILSLEEAVRLLVTVVVFKKKIWMQSL
ncbi:MATE family efflux transporter [Anaerovibrio sp.]|uniref:MATE family efflux transporter n=1 Tax=Anaerovibrio sp. TaxID=1872532 RepID=UPI00263001D9|nr:MATE family efflux transporter [Anaerovibrio sp.]